MQANMSEKNILVVGQGIAGSLVTFALHTRSVPFMVMDPGSPFSASRIAAGMFTPVSGKRKTVHPLVPQQIPYAIAIYEAIQHLIGAPILHQQPVLQLGGAATPSGYSRPCTVQLPGLKGEPTGMEISDSGWVDCPLWLNSFAAWLHRRGALVAEDFIHSELEFTREEMAYHGSRFTGIIFCEGYRATNNPFFRDQRIIPCKGDILTVRTGFRPGGRIIKTGGIYLIESGDGFFRAGSTYQWSNDEVEPDPGARRLIEGQLDQLLDTPYDVVEHQSGIRPTTANREVIATQHSGHKGLFMLNGLGTKGILQGPWWARAVVDLCLG
jgi:glycine oxidase